MKLRFVFAAVAPLLIAGLSSAQGVQDPNPSKKPPTFLGGPKYKKDKTPTSRFLKGTVVDESGKPLEGALVTLTNTKSNEKTTFITKKDGRYNFADLSFTIDYGLQAKYKNQESASRKLSQYDRTAEITRVLEVGQALSDTEAKK